MIASKLKLYIFSVKKCLLEKLETIFFNMYFLSKCKIIVFKQDHSQEKIANIQVFRFLYEIVCHIFQINDVIKKLQV